MNFNIGTANKLYLVPYQNNLQLCVDKICTGVADWCCLCRHSSGGGGLLEDL